jgi:hypothetical protein
MPDITRAVLSQNLLHVKVLFLWNSLAMLLLSGQYAAKNQPSQEK